VGRNRWRIVATTIIGLSACSPVRVTLPVRPPERLSPAADWGEPVRLIRTTSVALDRISKRQPRLDSTLRRARTGAGVAIYVFDGGVSEYHRELSGHMRLGFDAFPSAPRLCNPHGTAVAGAAAGATLGVAPDAEIVDVKIINCDHLRGSVTAILAAARWAVEDHAKHPGQPAIANWSFAVDTGRAVPEIDRAAQILHDAGFLLVVAAGNVETDACHVSPANAPHVLVVGASALVDRTDGSGLRRDVRAPNTAWGPCISLYAPGDSVELPSLDRGLPSVMVWNGTSMAAGYVSGAAALILERDPTASPDRVAQLLLSSATQNMVDDRRGNASGWLSRLLYIGPAERVIASAQRFSIGGSRFAR
jgi:subtilisin family serine protease